MSPPCSASATPFTTCKGCSRQRGDGDVRLTPPGTAGCPQPEALLGCEVAGGGGWEKPPYCVKFHCSLPSSTLLVFEASLLRHRHAENILFLSDYFPRNEVSGKSSWSEGRDIVSLRCTLLRTRRVRAGRSLTPPAAPFRPRPRAGPGAVRAAQPSLGSSRPAPGGTPMSREVHPGRPPIRVPLGAQNALTRTSIFLSKGEKKRGFMAVTATDGFQ